MMTHRSVPVMSEFVTRLAVTLGALAVYSLGRNIPLPGLNLPELSILYQNSPTSAVEHISIFALSVTPLISALMLVEAARLASERFNDWVDAAPTNARRVNGYALIGALLIAVMQGNAVANGLDAAGSVVAEPGFQFRLNVIATLVASTVLLAWLANVISQYGLGSGIWILLFVPHLASLPTDAAPLLNEVRVGFRPATGLVATLAYVVIALAAFVAVVRVLTVSRVPLERALIWPLYLATWMMGIFATLAMAIQTNLMGEPVFPIFAYGALPYVITSMVLLIALSIVQWERLKPRPATAGTASPPAVDTILIALTILAQAALILAPWIITVAFDIPMLISPVAIVAMVVFALPIQALLQGRQH